MSAKPYRVRLQRTAGFRIPPNTVKVDRATKWGNPFIAFQVSQVPGFEGIRVESRRHAFDLYREWALTNDKLVREARAELRSKNLACWCHHPNQAQVDICHATILLEIANG